MCDEKQTQHDKYYVEPSEELKPAIDLLLRIGRDKQLRSVFEELVKTQEFAECVMKYYKHFWGGIMQRYYVTGYSARFGNWIAEVYECRTMTSAKERFIVQYPTLKSVKAYALRA